MTTSKCLSPKCFAAHHCPGVGSVPFLKQMKLAPIEMADLRSFCEEPRLPLPCPENLMDRVKDEHQEPWCLLSPLEEQVGPRFHWHGCIFSRCPGGWDTVNLLWGWICSLRTFLETSETPHTRGAILTSSQTGPTYSEAGAGPEMQDLGDGWSESLGLVTAPTSSSPHSSDKNIYHFHFPLFPLSLPTPWPSKL